MLKEFKNIKQIIVVIIILFIYCIGVGVFISYRHKDEKNNKNNNSGSSSQTTKDTSELDMILTPNTIISYKDSKWTENNDLDYSDIKFKVYTDKDYKDLYVTYTDEWYIMDSGRSFIDFDKDLGFAAISSKTSTSFDYLEDSKNDSDNEVIKAFLESKDVKYNEETLKSSVYEYDINDDNIKDKIYILTNVFLEDYSGYDKTFSYVFVRSLNQNITAYEDVSKNVNAMNMCSPKLRGILTFKNSSILITDCSYISNNGTKHTLYSMEEKSITKLLETKAN